MSKVIDTLQSLSPRLRNNKDVMALVTATEDAKRRALTASKRAREALSEAAYTGPVASVGGSAAAGVADRYLPTVIGRPPSLVLGAVITAVGISQKDANIANLGAGMLGKHVYDWTASMIPTST